MRVNHPAGWFYTSDALRTLCDIWERHGSGLTNMHGSTGDIIFLGTKTDELEPTFEELTRGRLRPGRLRVRPCGRPRCCVGPGALRVGLLRHPEALLRPDHALPGRAAPPAVPVQVQVQVLAAARTTAWPPSRGPTCPSSAPGRTRSSRTRREVAKYAAAGPRHPEGRLRPLPHASAWSGTARS